MQTYSAVELGSCLGTVLLGVLLVLRALTGQLALDLGGYPVGVG